MRAGMPPICRERGHHRISSVRDSLSMDIRRYIREASPYSVRGDSLPKRVSVALTPSILSALLYRISHLLHARGWRRASYFMASANHLINKIAFSPCSCIGGGLYVPHPVGVIFHGQAGEDLTLFARSACLSAAPTLVGFAEEGPRLGDRVSLGAESAVVGAVAVGSDTRIAFRATLAEDAPPRSLVLSRAARRLAARPGTRE